MNDTDNLELFQELISCNHNLYLWQFTPEMSLIKTNCPEDLINGYLFFLKSQSQPLALYASEGQKPFIMDTFLNVLWAADFYRPEKTLQSIYIIGPVFTGNYSYRRIIKKLESRELSVSTRVAIMKQLEHIPIISSNIIFQYAVMLHYCLCGEKISFKDFCFSSKNKDTAEPSFEKTKEDHNGIWASEQVLLDMVRNGNLKYMDALSVSSSLSSGIKFESVDMIQRAKNNCLALLILVSRAAIEGGLNPDTSYTLCDYYAQRIEDTDSVSEFSILCQTLMEDYIQRVRSVKESSNISHAVLNCCDYITAHISDNLSIDFLSSRAGYTEYYFSRKFKEEIGISVKEYINKEKIHKAQILLSSTNMDINEISVELGFSSRSYFTDLFQRITGESPAKYRKVHYKGL